MVTLEPVDRVRVTLLVDNLTDPLIVDQGPVGRMSWPRALSGGLPRIPVTTAAERGVPDVLVAEPGFAALVVIERQGKTRTLLFDTGVSPNGLVDNMVRLGISPRDIEVLVLSHGHWDHVTGVAGLVKALGRRSMPVMIHPEFWSRRRVTIPGLEPVELPATSRSALMQTGFDIIEESQPSFLLDGAALITGEIDRTTDFETGYKGHERRRDGDWEPDPLILDDQALVLRIRDRGLMVLTGCGHAGIVNTVRYAKRLTGEDRIAAIIGGFHLSGPLFEPLIAPTVDALAALSPGLLVPAHCTGFNALQRIAARFPDAFAVSAVGMTVDL